MKLQHILQYSTCHCREVVVKHACTYAQSRQSAIGFFSSRPNWDSPISTASVSPPFVGGGGGRIHSLAGDALGVGESQFRRVDRHYLYLYFEHVRYKQFILATKY